MRMAHRDAKVVEPNRYMARRKHSATGYSSDPTWSDSDADPESRLRLLAGRVGGLLGIVPGLVRRGRKPRVASGTGEITPLVAPAVAPTAAPAAASASSAGSVGRIRGAVAGISRLRSGSLSLPAGRSAGSRRRFGSREPHRRELAVVLMLLLVACAASVSLPEFANSSPKSASLQLANAATDPTADQTPDPTADPTGGDPSPSESASIEPASASPSATPKPAATPKPKPTPYNGKKYTFVALGDSLTSGYGIVAPAWPVRLDKSDVRLTLAHNAGIPGNVTSQMLARLDHDVFAYKPDVVLVMGGTNDLARGYSTATTIANLRAIIVACQKRKIRVFLLTIPPDGYTGMAKRINTLNAAIIHLANSYRITYVDVHATLSTKSGVYIAGYGLADNVHLTATGAQVLSNTVYYRIRRLGY